jgi:hypothetical protein
LNAQVSTTCDPWVLMILINWPPLSRTALPRLAGILVTSPVLAIFSPTSVRDRADPPPVARSFVTAKETMPRRLEQVPATEQAYSRQQARKDLNQLDRPRQAGPSRPPRGARSIAQISSMRPGLRRARREFAHEPLPDEETLDLICLGTRIGVSPLNSGGEQQRVTIARRSDRRRARQVD